MNTAKTYPQTFSAATIHEYNMVAKGLARVTCSVNRDASREQIAASVNEALQGAGNVVPGSFRILSGDTAVGFVAASREVRPIEKISEIAKNYRVLSSNVYLDNDDKSLWDLKEGASGKYLVRNGVDDLESLIQASRVSPTGSIPRLSRVAVAAVEKHEFVAFVKQTNWTTDVAYGFCVKANANGTMTLATEDGLETVSNDTVVGSYVTEGKKPQAIKSSAFDQPIKDMKDYYRLAYGDQDGGKGDQAQQDYVDAIIEQIDQMAVV